MRSTPARLIVLFAGLLALASCGEPAAAGKVDITLVADSNVPAYITVRGLGPRTRRAARSLAPTASDWKDLLVVSVVQADGSPSADPIAGKYSLVDGAIRFTPLFGFDPGRRYQVRYYGGPDRATGVPLPVEQLVTMPAAAVAAAVHVTQIYPTGDIVPENQLRMYIHFSGPMGRRGGLEHVKLFDDNGRRVVDPFLPVDGELWNSDRTRFTVFFDPGRQKRGILPNREMGPSLVAGRKYTLRIERAWLDGNGQRLRDAYARSFTVGPADVAPLDVARWKVAPPREGTREPVIVTFPEPLDHGLLLRAVGVRRDGVALVGDVQVDAHETRWTMTPKEAWRPGRYEVIALGILEDLAGNRIGRAFEVDDEHRPTSEDDSKITSLPFSLAR